METKIFKIQGNLIDEIKIQSKISDARITGFIVDSIPVKGVIDQPQLEEEEEAI